MPNADYTFYFDNLAIFLDNSETVRENTNSVFLKNEKALSHFVNSFRKEKPTEDVLLYGYDASKMFGDFKNHFLLIEAAGGIVKNSEHQFLFIKRFGIWDLPKGKIEKGEGIMDGAIREVEEETGIHSPKINASLPVTFHIYKHSGDYVLKKTYWYLMEVNDRQLLKPQTEEDITEVVWFNIDESKKALAQSYRSLNDSLSRYFIE